MTERDASALLPLTPAVFHVLLSLVDEERHGYAVIKEVETSTDGRVRLGAGTLYGIVKRLLADGLVEETRTRPPADEDDQRRRYYRLTRFGRRVLEAEAERLAQEVSMARDRNLLKRVRTAS